MFLEDLFSYHRVLSNFYKFKIKKYQKNLNRQLKVKKSSTLLEVLKQIAEMLGHSLDEIRVWTLMTRYNFTVRPYNCVEPKENAHKLITDASKQDSVWNVFVETASDFSFSSLFEYSRLLGVSDLESSRALLTTAGSSSKKSCGAAGSPTARLPSYTAADEVMIFFKFYEPRTSSLRYVFKLYVAKKSTLNAIQERVNRKMRFPLDTELLFFEEVRITQIKPILVFDKPLDKLAHEELLTGDIYVFQVNEKERLEGYELPTVPNYFQVSVTY